MSYDNKHHKPLKPRLPVWSDATLMASDKTGIASNKTEIARLKKARSRQNAWQLLYRSRVVELAVVDKRVRTDAFAKRDAFASRRSAAPRRRLDDDRVILDGPANVAVSTSS